jgi:hypothetical protein
MSSAHGFSVALALVLAVLATGAEGGDTVTDEKPNTSAQLSSEVPMMTLKFVRGQITLTVHPAQPTPDGR